MSGDLICDLLSTYLEQFSLSSRLILILYTTEECHKTKTVCNTRVVDINSAASQHTDVSKLK